MSKDELICPNNDCSRYDQNLSKYQKVTYRYQSGKGLVPTIETCPNCGEKLITVKREEEGDIGFSFGRFASSDNATKKEMLLKRNSVVAKEDRMKKEYYANKQIKKMMQ